MTDFDSCAAPIDRSRRSYQKPAGNQLTNYSSRSSAASAKLPRKETQPAAASSKPRRLKKGLRQVFEGRPLRELLMEAVLYGGDRRVQDTLEQEVETRLENERIREIHERHALVHTELDGASVEGLRQKMEEARLRKLQPHFIEAFFVEGFRFLGGRAEAREKGCWELAHVPSEVCRHAERHGTATSTRYERVTFRKDSSQNQQRVAWLYPGHGLLDAVVALCQERVGNALAEGALFVDRTDPEDAPRVVMSIELGVEDGRLDSRGEKRLVARRLHFVAYNVGRGFVGSPGTELEFAL